MKSLQEFYNNKDTKDNVYNYLIEFLKEEVVRLAFEEKEVSGAVLAKKSIDKAFENLETLFEPLPKKNNSNQSR